MKPSNYFNDNMDIIRKHQKKPPLDLKALAKDLGIGLFTTEEWSDNISGSILQNEKSKSGYSIYVNVHHHKNRQRFTIAHEIAHFILHKDKIGNGIQDDVLFRSNLTNQLEKEANLFAADLLMPLNLIEESSTSDIEELAEKFKVSPQAMAIKLGTLGAPYDYK